MFIMQIPTRAIVLAPWLSRWVFSNYSNSQDWSKEDSLSTQMKLTVGKVLFWFRSNRLVTGIGVIGMPVGLDISLVAEDGAEVAWDSGRGWEEKKIEKTIRMNEINKVCNRNNRWREGLTVGRLLWLGPGVLLSIVWSVGINCTECMEWNKISRMTIPT